MSLGQSLTLLLKSLVPEFQRHARHIAWLLGWAVLCAALSPQFAVARQAGNPTASGGIHLYTGEQIDPDLGMYYLRARYYQPATGRFWNMDSYEGSQGTPQSLHKYLYCHGNPINGVDPSGHDFSCVSIGSSMSMVTQLGSLELKGGHAALVGARDMFGADGAINDLIAGLGYLSIIEEKYSQVMIGAAAAYGSYKLIQFFSGGTKLIKNIKAITAAEANAGSSYPNTSGYGPPYKSGTRPRSFTTAAEIEFVRLHGPSNQEGHWVVRADEIRGMSPAQIKEHLALKHTPTQMSKVKVPANKEMRVGIAAEQPNFGVSGGGTQYELRDLSGVTFSSPTPL